MATFFCRLNCYLSDCCLICSSSIVFQGHSYILLHLLHRPDQSSNSIGKLKLLLLRLASVVGSHESDYVLSSHTPLCSCDSGRCLLQPLLHSFCCSGIQPCFPSHHFGNGSDLSLSKSSF